MFTLKPEQTTCSTESHNCCTPAPKDKAVCPSCGISAKEVLSKTVDALLTPAAKAKLSDTKGFHFCKTPTCSVVYFKENILLTQEDLDVIVGLKEGASPRTLCYCFNITEEMVEEEIAATGTSKAKTVIKEKMQSIGCACEIKNPSGGCCLADVGKAIKEVMKMTTSQV